MAGCFERACLSAKVASAACLSPTEFESRTSGVDPYPKRPQRVKPWTGDSKGTAEFEPVTVRFPAVCNCLQISLSTPLLVARILPPPLARRRGLHRRSAPKFLVVLTGLIPYRADFSSGMRRKASEPSSSTIAFSSDTGTARIPKRCTWSAEA